MSGEDMGINHRIGQEERRRKEADAKVAADATERDVRVLNQAKAYTDQRVGMLEQRLAHLLNQQVPESDARVVELRAQLRAV